MPFGSVATRKANQGADSHRRGQDGCGKRSIAKLTNAAGSLDLGWPAGAEEAEAQPGSRLAHAGRPRAQMG
jgi:hypothetical protein